MASSTSRRSRRRLSLSVRDPDSSRDPGSDGRRGLELPWLPAAVGGGVAAALLGWIGCVGLAVLGWLGASAGTLRGALEVGAQLLFLAHGVPIDLAGVRVSLVPLGLTLLLGLAVLVVSRFAARRLLASGELPSDPRQVDHARLVRRVAAMTTIGYVGTMLVFVIVLGDTTQLPRVLLGTLAIAGLNAVLGAGLAVRARPWRRLPGWLRPVPAAVAAGLATMVLIGAVVLAGAVIGKAGAVGELSSALDLPALGGVVMLVLQLAYLPNLVLWCGAYVLGAGFGLGDGSVVSPVVTQLGLLPAIPITAALPEPGIHGAEANLWLLGGVLAGGLAGYLVVRARPLARFDETTLVGGLGGVLVGLLFTGLAALSAGAMGSGRLTALGPRLPELLVMAPVTMGLAGAFAGLVFGLLKRRAWLGNLEGPEREQEEDEPTLLVALGEEDDDFVLTDTSAENDLGRRSSEPTEAERPSGPRSVLAADVVDPDAEHDEPTNPIPRPGQD